MGKTVCVIFLFLTLGGWGQDTIRVMHYNLLNYGNYYGDCNSLNNNVTQKNQSLKTVVDFIQPDILSVNEISEDPFYHNLLLASVFNTNGITHFKRGYPPNLAYAPIMNGIFYNSQVLTLLSNVAVETNYRDIDIFRFLYSFSDTQDSIILNLVVAHLKAGSDSDDEQERTSETNKLMNYLADNNLDGNFILCGDLNLYSGSEPAFQKLLLHPDEDIRFYDPINQVGEWHNNEYFASVHTQSTHTSGSCPATGGMDDRFDFILASEEVMEGLMGIKYNPSSYQAIGQDGIRFNESLVNPTNNSLPSNIITALYNTSDHLPLTMELLMDDPSGDINNLQSPVHLAFQNPASGSLALTLSFPGEMSAEILLSDLYGNTRWKSIATIGYKNVIHIPLQNLADGMYFILVKNQGELLSISKLIISNQ